MHPMILLAAMVGATGAEDAPPTAEPTVSNHPSSSSLWADSFGAGPRRPAYRPDLSLPVNREQRRARPTYRLRGIGITRGKRNPRR